MGVGCAAVRRTRNTGTDVAVGTWGAPPQTGPGQRPVQSRLGRWRDDPAYSGNADTASGSHPLCEAGLTPEECLAPMLDDVVKWFR